VTVKWGVLLIVCDLVRLKVLQTASRVLIIFMTSVSSGRKVAGSGIGSDSTETPFPDLEFEGQHSSEVEPEHFEHIPRRREFKARHIQMMSLGISMYWL